MKKRNRINRDKLVELMQRDFEGNYNHFARELRVDPSHLYRFLKTGIGGGGKIVLAVLKLCKDRDMDYGEYINI